MPLNKLFQIGILRYLSDSRASLAQIRLIHYWEETL